MVTIKQGGPRCPGWALGRHGVEEAALGLTGSKRHRVSIERTRTSTRLHKEEKEAAKADSTQNLGMSSCIVVPPSHQVKLRGSLMILIQPALCHVETQGPNREDRWHLQDRLKSS